MRFGLLVLCLGGCGGARGPDRPVPAEGGGILRPLQVYRQIGLLAGSEQFPAVASFATVAGPSDSTYVLFGLSLPNSALRFQREGDGFVGRYTVSLSFARDSQQVREITGRETVRVPSFAETGRTDESVVYQTVVALTPGRYTVQVEARDGSGGAGFEAQDTLEVPGYRGERRLAAPVFVYRAQGRTSESASPELIVNPRHTAPYGGESPRVYLEGYGYPAGQPVQLRVLNDQEAELWQTQVPLQAGEASMSHALVEIPAESLPLGRLWVETAVEGEAGAPARVPLIVTISDQWMVANFDEVLEFLTYIATGDELDSLKTATGAERAERWERFWERRDPVPATPINEYREDFFERIRIATLHFGEPGRPGWKTDRGEVFIVLGPPDHIIERRLGRADIAGRPNAFEWIYERGPGGRMVLTFLDRNGFERYELTPSSRSAFRSAASRLKRRN